MIKFSQFLMMQLFTKDPAKRDHSEVLTIASFLEKLRFIQKIKEETSRETVLELSKCVRLESFKEGQVRDRQHVFREGDRGFKFYIVISGRVAFLITTRRVNETTDEEEETQLKVGAAESGAAFGELALLQDKPRAASVLCEVDCTFGVIAKDDYGRIIGRHTQRQLEAKVNFLGALPIFAGWKRHNIAKLTYYMTEIKFNKHRKVCREGESCSAIYIVEEGEFKLLKTMKTVETSPLRRKHFQKIHIATIAKGEILGVTELLEKSAWKHTCECSSAYGKLMKISVEVGFT